jgi:hypothetical protein
VNFLPDSHPDRKHRYLSNIQKIYYFDRHRTDIQPGSWCYEGGDLEEASSAGLEYSRKSSLSVVDEKELNGNTS